MLSGSMAMNYYAQPRMTRDIDIVIILKLGQVGSFVKLFDADYYIDAETVKAEVGNNGMFNVIHNELIIKVDFILNKDGEYDRVAFERRKHVDIDGFNVTMISPEDLIIRKILWGTEADSDLQSGDVKNIYKMVDDIDESYLLKWSRELNIEAELEKIRQ